LQLPLADRQSIMSAAGSVSVEAAQAAITRAVAAKTAARNPRQPSPVPQSPAGQKLAPSPELPYNSGRSQAAPAVPQRIALAAVDVENKQPAGNRAATGTGADIDFFSAQLAQWYFGKVLGIPFSIIFGYPPPNFIINWIWSDTVQNDPLVHAKVSDWLKTDADTYITRPPGTYDIGRRGKVIFSADSLSGFILNESQLSYKGKATVSRKGGNKSVSISADFLFHDRVDANSFKEIDPWRWKSGFWSGLLAVDEGLWDVFVEKILNLGVFGVSEGVPFDITWSESYSK
jgi:hypothetical protein